MASVGNGAIVCALVAFMAGSASAEEVGNWTVGAGQGFVEYTVNNGPGNSFAFSCDEGFSPDGQTKKTGVLVTIIGKGPPPKSSVQAFADGKSAQFYADERGIIDTTCHACSGNFVYLWDRVRRSKQLIVSFSDGRSATFRLNGAAKALPAKHCTTGFES